MPAFLGVACASGIGSIGLEESELVGIGTEPVVDAEAFSMGPVVGFGRDEVEFGAPMVSRCARHRGETHDLSYFGCVVALCVLPFAFPYLSLAVEVACGGYYCEGDAFFLRRVAHGEIGVEGLFFAV